MTYQQLLETVSEILENEKLYKKGLILTYELDETNHKQMNEELFFKANPINSGFTSTDEFEVEIGGILVKFTKEK